MGGLDMSVSTVSLVTCCTERDTEGLSVDTRDRRFALHHPAFGGTGARIRIRTYHQSPVTSKYRHDQLDRICRSRRIHSSGKSPQGCALSRVMAPEAALVSRPSGGGALDPVSAKKTDHHRDRI